MTTTDVIVIGAGPTGLMLACELALGGLTCQVLERRTEQPNITRAFAVHARTLELLDMRGLADELVPRGLPVREVRPVPGALVDLRRLDTRFPMILIAPQSGTEHLLERRARELGVADRAWRRGQRAAPGRRRGDRRAFRRQHARTASYVVGADGAHSTVRGLLGVDFVGKEYATHILLADVRLTEPPEQTLFNRISDAGAVIVVPFGDGWFRAIAWDHLHERVPLDVPLPMETMRDAFQRIAGTDFGMCEQRWSSRFLSERRQARDYRVGRVFLAGDAAHVHSPLGGQGMNTGMQDAMNLGWKLVAAVRGNAPAGLLDSYQDERHRVGAQVLTMTDGFNRLVDDHSAIRRGIQARIVRTLLWFGPTRRRTLGRLTGLGIAYPAPRRTHPWTGRRMPDVACHDGRLYALLRDGGFVLLDTTASGEVARAVRATSPQVRAARSAAAGTPAAVLVRPDGYVAWASEDRSDVTAAAVAAVARWCRPRADVVITGGVP